MNAEPSWDLYRTFDAVLREGSLSGAARALGLTQPSVARHVDALEAAIGRRLFLRTQRGLSPTEAAIELKPYAEMMASASAAFLRTSQAAAGEVGGTVRISASEVVGTVHLPAILTKLRRAHPSLALELVLSNALDDLLQRKADVAVRMVRPEQQALVARRVGIIPVGLFARRDYLALRGMPTTIEELPSHDVIGDDVETRSIRAIAQHYPMLTRDSFALRVGNDVAQLFAIHAGFGIGFCQVPIGGGDPDLVRVLEGDFQIDLETWVVMHEDLKGSARCRVVFDALVEGISAIAES